MQDKNVSPAPILLVAKYRPCDCHACVKVECIECNDIVFQTSEKMDILNKEKGRAYHICPKCIVALKKQYKDRLIEVNIDRPAGNKQ